MNNKKILIFIDAFNFNEKIRTKIDETWNGNVEILIFDSIQSNFKIFNNGKIIAIEEIDRFLLLADKVLNLMRVSKQYKEVQKKIESYKIKFIGNRLSTIEFLKDKNTFKSIIKKLNYSNSVFKKIGNSSPDDLFLNFIQPSRIYSKDNYYFSDKLKTIDDIKKIFNEKININDYFIEEYLNGDNIYSLIIKANNKIVNIIYKVQDGEIEKINIQEKEYIQDKTTAMFQELNIDEIALIHLKKDKQKDYFLNIFVGNDILLNDVVNNMLDDYGMGWKILLD